MDRMIRYLIEALQRLEKMDKAKLVNESKELYYFIKAQTFKQIPSVSAIGGIVVGAWISSTFTTSQVRGTLASLGIIKGAKHVVSSTTYSFLSILLPVLAAAVTAYVIQKTLKTYREKQLQRNLGVVASLAPEIQAQLQAKLALLEKAKEAGLLSASEFDTKKSSLYQSYSRDPSRIEDFIINRLAS